MKGRKGSTDEGGVRVPLFIRWPGKIAPGTEVRQIAGAIDLLPTLAAFTGSKRVGDKPLDGRDLSPLLLRGSDADWQERMLFNLQGRQGERAQASATAWIPAARSSIWRRIPAKPRMSPACTRRRRRRCVPRWSRGGKKLHCQRTIVRFPSATGSFRSLTCPRGMECHAARCGGVLARRIAHISSTG